VDWNAWWVAIDKRVEEHLVNEREMVIEAVAQTIATLSDEIAENEKLRGPPGRAGQDGKLPQAKLWRDQVHYAGEVVVYDGSCYQAVNDTGKTPSHSKDWTLLAVAGCDGKSIRHRGAFEDGVEYRALDAVLVDGTSYLAIVDDPGPCPTGKGWQLLATAGRDGKEGATGPQGERGERGLIGPRGEPAPTINSWRLDRASYTATPLLSNGLEGAALELRGLFEQFVADTK
jgi:hypothetical protein